MADEPRVARLHLVPAPADGAGDGVPVAELGDVRTDDDGDRGASTAALRLIGPGAEPGRPVRVAALDQIDGSPGPASGGAARLAALERAGRPGPERDGPARVVAVDQVEGSPGPERDGPARVAAMDQIDGSPGRGTDAPVRGTVDVERIGAPAQRPVGVALFGPTGVGRSPSGDREEGRGAARSHDRRPGEPERSPSRRSRRVAEGSGPAATAPAGADARPRSGPVGGRSRAGPRRDDLDAAGAADDARISADAESSPPRRVRRPPGPQQIDPDADPVAAAKDICLDLLTVRARTKHELAEALRRRGVPDEAAATALDRFDEVGLIDDAAFAGQWVRSRQRGRGLARRALAVELRRKGVDDEIAGEALAVVDADAEELRARELVGRKLRTVPADTPEQRTSAARRLVGMLARKGYPGGLAYRVVREALAAHGADIDELGSEPSDD